MCGPDRRATLSRGRSDFYHGLLVLLCQLHRPSSGLDRLDDLQEQLGKHIAA